MILTKKLIQVNVGVDLVGKSCLTDFCPLNYPLYWIYFRVLSAVAIVRPDSDRSLYPRLAYDVGDTVRYIGVHQKEETPSIQSDDLKLVKGFFINSVVRDAVLVYTR